MTTPLKGDTVRGAVSWTHPKLRDFVLTRDAEPWPTETHPDRIRVFTCDEYATRRVGELREVPTIVWGWTVVSPSQACHEQTVERTRELVERGECDPSELAAIEKGPGA